MTGVMFCARWLAGAGCENTRIEPNNVRLDRPMSSGDYDRLLMIGGCGKPIHPNVSASILNDLGCFWCIIFISCK